MALCLLTGCSAGNSVIAPEVTAVIPAETAAVTEPSEVREEQPEENNTIAATTPEAPAETEHIHDWTETFVVPTCTERGYTQRSCFACGETAQDTFAEPAAHTWSAWETAVQATETSQGGAELRWLRKEVLPAAHDWQHHHEDEVGHYDVYIVCHCGWRCSAAGDYISRYAGHINSLPADEKWTHSYYDTGVWVVDIPARDWDQCTVCGATK